MSQTIAAQIAALDEMTTGELREKYREVFGEETRSRNKKYLIKKVAWRIQANAEGGLSERAKQRAKDLACEADIRVNPPRKRKRTTKKPADPAPERTVVHRFGPTHDPRLPLPGAVLKRDYKGKTHVVSVLEEGFEWDGTVHGSLSAVAKAITGTNWNGFLFFGLTSPRRKKATEARQDKDAE